MSEMMWKRNTFVSYIKILKFVNKLKVTWSLKTLFQELRNFGLVSLLFFNKNNEKREIRSTITNYVFFFLYRWIVWRLESQLLY